MPQAGCTICKTLNKPLETNPEMRKMSLELGKPAFARMPANPLAVGFPFFPRSTLSHVLLLLLGVDLQETNRNCVAQPLNA